MSSLSNKYPVTLIFCIIWSITALFFILLDVNNLFNIIFGIPIIIFIPGYLFVYVLFPEKTEKVVDVIDRIALGIGLSIAIVPLFGIILYYSPLGLSFLPIILSLELFNLIMGTIAILRWFRTPPDKRYIPTINISIPKNESKSDKLLTIIVIISSIITVSLIFYAIFTPKSEEHFTEFYILGSNQSAYKYPMKLIAGQNTSVILGLINHENRNMNYSIEVWLSNQTTELNTSSNVNVTIYHNLWFMGNIKDPKTDLTHFELPPQPINLQKNWTSQWEYNYTINITKFDLKQNTTYKIIFLLYITPKQNFIKNTDYKNIAIEKADSNHTTAYRNLYLWIKVQ